MKKGRFRLCNSILIFQYILLMSNFPFFILHYSFYPPLRIQSIKHIQNIIKFVNVLTIGKRNKYIFIIGENKFI